MVDIEQDDPKKVIGKIVRIRFGDDTGIYKDKYLDEFKNGQRKYWNTPTNYLKKLKTGKMMLYDSKREAITIEFRVYDIDNIGGDFQFSNKFMQEDVKIFEPGIPLSVIEKIGHFNGFGHKRRVDWKLHRDEYNMLLNRYQGKIINFMKDLDDK